jgi:hypothetical protein
MDFDYSEILGCLCEIQRTYMRHRTGRENDDGQGVA